MNEQEWFEKIVEDIIKYLKENKIPYKEDDIRDYYKRFNKLSRGENNNSNTGVS